MNTPTLPPDPYYEDYINDWLERVRNGELQEPFDTIELCCEGDFTDAQYVY